MWNLSFSPEENNPNYAFLLVELKGGKDGIDVLFYGPDDMKLRMGIPINTPVAGTACPVKRFTRSSYRPPPATDPNCRLRPFSSKISKVNPSGFIC